MKTSEPLPEMILLEGPPTPLEILEHTDPTDYEGQHWIARVGRGVPVVVRLWAVMEWDPETETHVPTGEQRGDCEFCFPDTAQGVIDALEADRWWKWVGPR